MNEALLPAIQDAKPWLDRFTRLEYGEAFTKYMARYAPTWRAAETSEPEALAESVLDALAEGRKRVPFWGRSARTFEEKQMMTVYLAPMLLEIGQEPLACALREAWVRRWPKDPWTVVRHEKLRKSFRRTFMGIELRSNHDEDED